jgi:hypothetical protein
LGALKHALLGSVALPEDARALEAVPRLAEPELLQLVQHLAHLPVVLHHAVGVDAETDLAVRGGLQVREDVHD